MTSAWFSPGSLRRLANAPLTSEAVEPVETPPSVADAHLDNLQAVCRQLRDDLAAAEAELARLRDTIECEAEEALFLPVLNGAVTETAEGLRSEGQRLADALHRLGAMVHPERWTRPPVRKVDLYEQLLACVGGTLVRTGRDHFAWQVGADCITFLTVDEADVLREVIG